MTHRVDRIYYEACELNQNLTSDLSFITKKQKQLQKKNQKQSHNKENVESGQFQVEKIINNVDNFRYDICIYFYRSSNLMLDNITNDSATPIKRTEYSPSNKARSSFNQEQIMNMILGSNQKNKVTLVNTNNNDERPISILKNRICPKNPSFGDK